MFILYSADLTLEDQRLVEAFNAQVDERPRGRDAGAAVVPFFFPDNARTWVADPHNHQLLVTIGEKKIMTAGEDLGRLDFVFNQHHPFSNYWNHMELYLPEVQWVDAQHIQFMHRGNRDGWVKWTSTEALFQAFKVFFCGDRAGFNWLEWAGKSPDEAKGAGRFRGQGANAILERMFPGEGDLYQKYQHHLFRWVCASVAVKFLTNGRLMRDLMAVPGWILEITEWPDGRWGGRLGEHANHKLGWILMMVRHIAFVTHGAVMNKEAMLRMFGHVFNSVWLWPGVDMSADGHILLRDAHGVSYPALDTFGLVHAAAEEY